MLETQKRSRAHLSPEGREGKGREGEGKGKGKRRGRARETKEKKGQGLNHKRRRLKTNITRPKDPKRLPFRYFLVSSDYFTSTAPYPLKTRFSYFWLLPSLPSLPSLIHHTSIIHPPLPSSLFPLSPIIALLLYIHHPPPSTFTSPSHKSSDLSGLALPSYRFYTFCFHDDDNDNNNYSVNFMIR